MAEISISIDVINSSQVVSKKKGKLISWLATQVTNPEGLKRAVEKKICQEIVESIRHHLDVRLKEEGIAANLKINVKA